MERQAANQGYLLESSLQQSRQSESSLRHELAQALEEDRYEKEANDRMIRRQMNTDAKWQEETQEKGWHAKWLTDTQTLQADLRDKHTSYEFCSAQCAAQLETINRMEEAAVAATLHESDLVK